MFHSDQCSAELHHSVRIIILNLLN